MGSHPASRGQEAIGSAIAGLTTQTFSAIGEMTHFLFFGPETPSSQISNFVTLRFTEPGTPFWAVQALGGQLCLQPLPPSEHFALSAPRQILGCIISRHSKYHTDPQGQATQASRIFLVDKLPTHGKKGTFSPDWPSESTAWNPLGDNSSS